MITTPRCGRPVKPYRLRRPRDAWDVVARPVLASPCYRPVSHRGKHLSEAAVRRDQERSGAWKRRRREQRIPGDRKMTDPGDRTAA